MEARYYALRRIQKPDGSGYWERGDEVEGASSWRNLQAWLTAGWLGVQPVLPEVGHQEGPAARAMRRKREEREAAAEKAAKKASKRSGASRAVAEKMKARKEAAAGDTAQETPAGEPPLPETPEGDTPDPIAAAGIVFGEKCPNCEKKHAGPSQAAAKCAEKLLAAK